MIAKVTHTPIFVENQDKALAFYTEKLGFVLHTDALFGENLRWLTITTKEQPTFELILSLADTDEKKALVGKQGCGMPLIAVEVDDCQKTYNDLVAKGVKEAAKPEMQPWGLSATVLDLYGNQIYLVQAQQ